MSNYWLDKKKQKEQAEMPQTLTVSIWDFESALAEEIRKSMEPVYVTSNCPPELLKRLGNTITSDQVKIVEIPELMVDLNPGPYDAPEVQPNEKGWELDL
jgi:hypothetical protein